MEAIERYELRSTNGGWCVWDLVANGIVARPVQDRAAAELAVDLLNRHVDPDDELGVLAIVASVMVNTPLTAPADAAAPGGAQRHPASPAFRPHRRSLQAGVLDEAQSLHA